MGELDDAAAAAARLEAALNKIASGTARQSLRQHQGGEAATEAAERIDRLIEKVRAALPEKTP